MEVNLTFLGWESHVPPQAPFGLETTNFWPGNYRPVSLTSVPGKMVESLIKDKILEHVEEQVLLKESQHGFCKDLLQHCEGIAQLPGSGHKFSSAQDTRKAPEILNLSLELPESRPESDSEVSQHSTVAGPAAHLPILMKSNSLDTSNYRWTHYTTLKNSRAKEGFGEGAKARSSFNQLELKETTSQAKANIPGNQAQKQPGFQNNVISQLIFDLFNKW